jgi:hypothetical protein
MKKATSFLLALLLASSFAAAAYAAGPGPFYAKGDHYAGTVGVWNHDAGNALTLAAGVWSGTVIADQGTGLARHEFKIANADWTESYYGPCNLWVHCAPGDAILFTFDTNVYADGWLPSTNIVWSDHFAPPGTTFEVIGSGAAFGEWTTPVAANLVSGVWTALVSIATPGSYEAKIRATGTWDVCNIGSEGAAAPCGPNLAYTTVQPDTEVLFEFNPATGRARVTVGDPTPASPTTFGRLKTLYR